MKTAFDSEGYPLLGWCVHYSTANFRISRSDFLKMLDECKLPHSVCPEILPKHALIRALKEVTRNTSTFYRLISEDSNKATFVIINEKVDHNVHDVDYEKVTRVEFDKNTHIVSVTGSDPGIEAYYKELCGIITGQQFRTIALRIVKTLCCGVSVRDDGGIYFVSKNHQVELEKLDELFLKTNDQADITLIPVVDTKASKNSMWKSALSEIKSEYKSLSEELNKIETITDTMLKVRLDRYNQLKEKISMYETLLSGTADELKESLDNLTKLIKEKVVEG